MINFKSCEIENTLAALQEAIENRKMQVQSAPVRYGSSSPLSYLFSEVFERAGGSYAQISNALEQAGDFVREFLKNAQLNIQESPWDVLRKVAVYGFAVGLFLSMRHRKFSTGEKV